MESRRVPISQTKGVYSGERETSWSFAVLPNAIVARIWRLDISGESTTYRESVTYTIVREIEARTITRSERDRQDNIFIASCFLTLCLPHIVVAAVDALRAVDGSEEKVEERKVRDTEHTDNRRPASGRIRFKHGTRNVDDRETYTAGKREGSPEGDFEVLVKDGLAELPLNLIFSKNSLVPDLRYVVAFYPADGGPTVIGEVDFATLDGVDRNPIAQDYFLSLKRQTPVPFKALDITLSPQNFVGRLFRVSLIVNPFHGLRRTDAHGPDNYGDLMLSSIDREAVRGYVIVPIGDRTVLERIRFVLDRQNPNPEILGTIEFLGPRRSFDGEQQLYFRLRELD